MAYMGITPAFDWLGVLGLWLDISRPSLADRSDAKSAYDRFASSQFKVHACRPMANPPSRPILKASPNAPENW